MIGTVFLGEKYLTFKRFLQFIWTWLVIKNKLKIKLTLKITIIQEVGF